MPAGLSKLSGVLALLSDIPQDWISAGLEWTHPPHFTLNLISDANRKEFFVAVLDKDCNTIQCWRVIVDEKLELAKLLLKQQRGF